MLRRFTIGMLTILGVTCTVLVGVATNLVANNNTPFIDWVKQNIGWILLTLTLVSIVVVLLLESLNRSEQWPTPALKPASRKPTRRNYRKLYLERLIYRYRDGSVIRFSRSRIALGFTRFRYHDLRHQDAMLCRSKHLHLSHRENWMTLPNNLLLSLRQL